MQILLDKNNKVFGISHEDTNSVEEGWIAVEDAPENLMEDAGNWSYIDGVWSYDADAHDADVRRAENRTTVDRARMALTESDYKILKFAESLLEVDSITDFLALIIRTRAELRDVVRQRVEWRRQINELEEETSYENQNQ